MSTLTLTKAPAARVTVVDYTDENIHAVYNGGPYINIYPGDRAGLAPVHAINVWDYETDTARIENTDEAVRAEVVGYIREFC